LQLRVLLLPTSKRKTRARQVVPSWCAVTLKCRLHTLVEIRAVARALQAISAAIMLVMSWFAPVAAEPYSDTRKLQPGDEER
jgi:hypothetical protein